MIDQFDAMRSRGVVSHDHIAGASSMGYGRPTRMPGVGRHMLEVFAVENDRDPGPGMVVQRPIVVAGQKLMHEYVTSAAVDPRILVLKIMPPDRRRPIEPAPTLADNIPSGEIRTVLVLDQEIAGPSLAVVFPRPGQKATP